MSGITPSSKVQRFDLITWLEGKKTYILSGIAGLYNILVQFGWISHSKQSFINTLLASGVAITIRAAISKLK